ncbi:MAG: radical SAM family heme chaperone HemW [Mycoplasmataceae bacterium]|nr:radical SAM family heme chaperone HemW [Mycoplasmataceae bacterium]
MTSKTKHLYVHIPFCKAICHYCDFVRFVSNSNCISRYTHRLINEINDRCKGCKFKTIYVGGGTPNSIDNHLLNTLLCTLSKYLAIDYEFTIECNPENITIDQAYILKTNNVNRVSIGMQTVNNTLLQKFGRQHTLKDVQEAISNLRKVGINNISIDLIYGFNELMDNDIRDTIKFIRSACIPHVAWYALEIKPGSFLNKNKYQLNDSHIEHQLKLIIKLMNDINYQRYEVSNWCIKSQFRSLHNQAYWLTHQWKAIGLGACGFEKRTYYEIKGNLKKYHLRKTKYSTSDYYFQIMMMGLRLQEGLDLTHPIYKKAYIYYKDKLKHVHVENNHLRVDNLNLLDNTLMELM